MACRKSAPPCRVWALTLPVDVWNCAEYCVYFGVGCNFNRNPKMTFIENLIREFIHKLIENKKNIDITVKKDGDLI